MPLPCWFKRNPQDVTLYEEGTFHGFFAHQYQGVVGIISAKRDAATLQIPLNQLMLVAEEPGHNKTIRAKIAENEAEQLAKSAASDAQRAANVRPPRRS